MMRTLRLLAPVDGVLVPLDEVPDPVFAQRLGGDGVAIEPLGDTFVAPCDARVTHVHRAGHALTLDVDGLELLLHVGLDTVQLAGEGFTPLVWPGDVVRTGTPLLRFDADLVSRRARRLVSPLLVTDPARTVRITAASGRVRGGVDEVLRIVLREGAGDGLARSDATAGAPATLHGDGVGPDFRRRIRVTADSGLHARPAATLAAAARTHAADMRLEKDGRSANLRSVVSILALEVLEGDVVTLVVHGRDARQVGASLVAAFTAGLGEPVADDATVPAARPPGAAIAAEPTAAARAPVTHGTLSGAPAAPGFAIGVAVVLRHDDPLVDAACVGAPADERRALDAAIAAAHVQLEALRTRLGREGHGEQATIFAAHQELLEDPEVLDAANAGIARGESAARSWRSACAAQADRLVALRNPLLAARATDLRDVGRRVLGLLVGHDATGASLPDDAVILADDLSPSDTVALDRTKVRGLATTTGSATSHVAILARGLGLPALAGVPDAMLAVPEGTRVLLDADAGTLLVGPDEREVAAFIARRDEAARLRAEALERAHAPAATRDGHRVEVAGNIGDPGEADELVRLGGEGVGLLRSEFAFLHRRSAPDEAAQLALYARAATALGTGRRLVIRTLDVGGDKPLPYLPMADEANPFLGERGIRLTLARPELLRTQVRAVLRASAHGDVALMFPMIAALAEWRAARAIVEEERAALGIAPIPVGIMVETAAAALLAEQFAREADFLSLGTNDLTQYTLAMDRTHPRLASQVDTLHPALLRLVERTVAGGHAHGRWVGVCGALAGDPAAIPVLVGLGVDELSVDVPLIPLVKQRVRLLDLAACRETAREALRLGSGAEVRALVAARHPRAAGADGAAPTIDGGTAGGA